MGFLQNRDDLRLRESGLLHRDLPVNREILATSAYREGSLRRPSIVPIRVQRRRAACRASSLLLPAH
jgi:hypothetical protein